MPFTALPNWLHGKASSMEIAVLWSLQFYAPEIRPSLATVARGCGLSRSTVAKVIADMERKGWLRREQRIDPTGACAPTLYQLNIWPVDQPPGLELVTPESSAGSPSAGRGIVRETDGGSPSAGRGLSVRRTGVVRETDTNKNNPTRSIQQEEETPPPPLAGGSRADSAVAADRGQPDTQALRLPACAEPHRALVVRWWKLRRIKHPGAPQQLDQRSHDAILHADAEGVLQPFLAWAAEHGPRTLGHGYRQRIAALSSPAGDAEGFERFKVAYLAAKKRASSQNLPKARVAFSRALAAGHTAEQLIGALRANVQAQNSAERDGGFAAALPDMARWLRDGLYEAHMGQDSQDGLVAAVAAPSPVSRAAYPEDLRDLPDPFAAYRS